MAAGRNFESFVASCNIIAALDHSGRAGNYFFQSIFDQHPEVLTCPWVQYTYSYFVTEFGSASEVDSRCAHKLWTEKSYFRLVYQDAVGAIEQTITSFGSDPKAKIDRVALRRVFDELVLTRETISRKDLILASFYAFAAGIGRELAAVKYILVSDAVSLRSENVTSGFSGQIVDRIAEDFPGFKLVMLERDPRAAFASCRQQYVNSNGNMYGVRPATLITRIAELLFFHFNTEGCVWLYWMLYFSSAAKLAYALKEKWKPALLVVKNEDLNLNFLPEMERITKSLDIRMADEWRRNPYEPTNVGSPWLGKGAYNPRYSKNPLGPLANDPDDVAKNITGPNVYVTQRWRKRLRRNEIAVIEHAFREEIDDLGYDYVVLGPGHFSKAELVGNLFQPFDGEIPNFAWYAKTWRVSSGAGLSASLYFITLPFLYLTARIEFLYFLWVRAFFNLSAKSKA